MRAYGLCLLVLFGLAVSVGPSRAQTEPAAAITVTVPADLDPAMRAEVLEALGAAGAIVGEPSTPASAGWQQAYAAQLDQAVVASAALAMRLAAYWDRLGGLGGLVLVVAAVGLGLFGWAVAERWAAPAPEPPLDRARLPFRARLHRALRSLTGDIVGIAAFLALSFAAGYLLLPVEPPAASLTLAGVAQIVTTALALIAIARALTNPVQPGARLAPLENDEARLVWRAGLVAIVLPVPFNIVEAVVVAVAARPAEAALTVIAVETVVTAVRIWLFWAIRQPMRGLIEHTFGNGRGQPQAMIVRTLAGGWFVVFSALALLRLLAVASSQLQGHAAGTAADLSFILLTLLPFMLGGIGAWFDDRAASGEDEPGPTTIAQVGKSLLQGVVLVVGLVVILRAWGIDPLTDEAVGVEDRIAGALLEASGALIIGWALWRGVVAILDRYKPGYAPGEDAAESEEPGMGKTGSRIDTLIPLIRSAAFGVIVLVSSLTVLSALGINITALLAGAGVIGLAVGFGAQTLVKDIITGIFYLLEDAFRVGEYLVTSEGKGVVEKISLRSVRLRHHRGPVYTIPFGSLGTIQNHSRDWVKIKLMLRVPFDTDIEKVRKLIKGVGLEMMEEPVLAEHIIQPVKSQGVLDVDDSAIVIGVKFLCKPGEQFLIRREAYARIKKAFADNAIDFAPKRVIVESDSAAGAQARAGAAAAAAAHMADEGMDAAS